MEDNKNKELENNTENNQPSNEGELRMAHIEGAESIWADGIPANIDPKMRLTFHELLGLSTDFLIKTFVIKNGFKLLSARADEKFLPNIIMEKEGKVYCVAVVPSVYPQFNVLIENVRKGFYDNCTSKNAIPLFAPIAFRSKDKARGDAGIALKGDLFDLIFFGFVNITGEDNQNLMVPREEYTMLGGTIQQ